MHPPGTELAFTCSRTATAHLSALDYVVREAAGTDLVVLVKGTLQKFVGIAVCSCIFKKGQKQKSRSANLPLINCPGLDG